MEVGQGPSWGCSAKEKKIGELVDSVSNYNSRDSTTIIVTGYWLDDRGVKFGPGRVKNFHFFMSFRPALGPTQPPIHCVPESLSPGVKRPWCEADH
jgi:hypothetical protein